jgi:hypothetical protein
MKREANELPKTPYLRISQNSQKANPSTANFRLSGFSEVGGDAPVRGASSRLAWWRLLAVPPYGVQHFLCLREKVVELTCRSTNVNDYRLTPDLHYDEPILPVIIRNYTAGEAACWKERNARALAAEIPRVLLWGGGGSHVYAEP